MARGPKPKSTALRVVDGTFRPDRHQAQAESEPMPEGELEKPKYLKGRASKIWDREAPVLSWLTRADSAMFGVWCSLQAEFEERPEDMVASRIGQLKSIGAELGLTSSGRARMGVSGKKKDVDPTAKFFDKKK